MSKNDVKQKILKQKRLKSLLVSRNYTEKDLKVEILLMHCESLISSYLNNYEKGLDLNLLAEKQNIPKLNSLDYPSDKINTVSIYEEMKNIHIYLQENVLTIDKLEKIFASCNGNVVPFQIQILDPYVFYYNKIAECMKQNLEKSQDEGQKKQWIPDLLSLNLILYLMIEKGYDFSKFSFIKHYDFSRIFDIYNKTNLILKKKKQEEDGTSLHISRIDTMITIMEDISHVVVDRLVNIKYVN